MSSSKSSQSSSTKNITRTVSPTLITSQGDNLSVVARDFHGEIGLTGSDAVRALSDFQDLQRDQALLNAQTTANVLAAFSNGPTGVFIPPAVSGTSSFATGGGTDGEAETATPAPRLNTAVLLLGGAAAVVTLFALRK